MASTDSSKCVSVSGNWSSCTVKLKASKNNNDNNLVFFKYIIMLFIILLLSFA